MPDIPVHKDPRVISTPIVHRVATAQQAQLFSFYAHQEHFLIQLDKMSYKIVKLAQQDSTVKEED